MRAKAILVCTLLLISAIGAEAASYQTIHSFTGYRDAGSPFAGVIVDQYGNLYGVAAWGEWNEGTIFQLTPSQSAWNFRVLHEFDLHDTEAAAPIGGLVMDEAGNLYGTGSYVHGPSEACSSVFMLSATGTFTILHYFYGADGCDPETTLTYRSGWLWGTTKGGGSNGQGTVFSMDTSGDSFQFHSFSAKKGNQPLSAFNLWGYGTTFSGGTKAKGNVYRLDPVKGLVSMHNFTTDGKAGYSPIGDLLTLYVDGVRTIYGTTSTGGTGGGGAVYRLTEIEPNSDRWRTTILHSFTTGSEEGWTPMAGLTADAAGNLYGTTYKGGLPDSNCGTVFKLSPGKTQSTKWNYNVLYSFDLYNGDGCNPMSGLTFDKAGNLYGTTTDGGEYYRGTVYEITP
ncbi:MAG TPA: choice-of-anchor tandem repeat GloVer-containing protein [Terriglobales bacterium]|nr:choice-of-anchor tandem repeat GloVer-containing protein [Terriglobales bacterium]